MCFDAFPFSCLPFHMLSYRSWRVELSVHIMTCLVWCVSSWWVEVTDFFFFFHGPNATVHYIDFLGGTSGAAETLIAMTIHHSRVITVGIFIMTMPNAWAMTWHWPRASWLFDWLVTSAVEAGSGQFWIADRHYLDCLATMMCRLTRHMGLHTVLYVSSTHLPIMLHEVQMFGFNTHWSVAGESIRIGLHHDCVCQMLTESAGSRSCQDAETPTCSEY